MDGTAYHDPPVREHDSFVIADISEFGMPGRKEHLWAKCLSNTTYEISSIPFFTYGIALGDHVEVDDRTGIILTVVKKSGHKTFRVAVSNEDQLELIHVTLHDWAERSKLAYEFLSPGYLAVDLPPDAKPELSLSELNQLEQSGDISTEIDG